MSSIKLDSFGNLYVSEIIEEDVNTKILDDGSIKTKEIIEDYESFYSSYALNWFGDLNYENLEALNWTDNSFEEDSMGALSWSGIFIVPEMKIFDDKIVIKGQIEEI